MNSMLKRQERSRQQESETQSMRIAVIVPTLDGTGQALWSELERQSCSPDEVHIIVNVRPNGKARNQGAAHSQSDILVFIDDDAHPGTPDLIEKLVRPLLEDPTIGVTGTARILPGQAHWFERRVAAEIPRMVNHVPEEPLETNPPLKGYGHSLITTTCCAMRRSVYAQAGGFSDTLTSGVDTDFFYRIRKLGYRFVMVPDTYVVHPVPANWRALWRKFYWYGLGYAQETQRRPEQKMGFRLDSGIRRLLFLVAATLWVIPNIFILYSFGYPHIELGFRPIKAFSTYAVAWGYAHAWQNGTQQ